MKKKSKIKTLEQLPETYTCPICGKNHKNEELCPIVLTRKKKMKYDTQSYVMGGIFLECMEQGIDFFQIIREIVYVLEFTSLESLSQCICINTDFVISYFASAIGCSPYKFYKKIPELISKYDSYIDAGVSSGSFAGVNVDEHNNIVEICLELDFLGGTLGDLIDNAGLYHSPRLYIYKVFKGRKPSYHLVIFNIWNEPGYRKKRDIYNGKYTETYFDIRNMCFGEHTDLEGYELYSEKEGKLKDIFESESEFIREDVADRITCSNSLAYEWTLKLDEATKKGLLRWHKHVGEYTINYSTVYGQTDVEIELVERIPSNEEQKDFWYHTSYAKGDSIRIYENDQKMYHYGEVSNSDEWYPRKPEKEDEITEIIQVPMFRRVAQSVEKWENIYQDKGFVESRNRKAIKKSDVLSVTYSFVCSEKGHIVIPYCGLVPIITPSGEEIDEKVYLGYCRNCGIYYIFRRDYDILCEKGKPKCKVIEASTKRILWDSSFSFNEKSILSEMGYNVQASENLSTEARHQILRTAIDNEKISVNEILNLLELQINLHAGTERYANAVEKWKEDADFVKSYGLDSGRIKRVSEITV